MNQIRLDWDDITWSECRNRIESLKQESIVQSIELLFSAKSGFHIYVNSYFHLPIQRIWYLRRLWKDDGNRLVMDVLHFPAYYRDVMFRKKGDWTEEPLTTYKRLHYNSDIWKKEDFQQNLSNQKSLKSSPVEALTFPNPRPKRKRKQRGTDYEHSR